MQRETRNLTQEECAQAVVLREEGWTYTRIAERFGVSHTSVSRMLQRFRETGMNVRRPGQGRARVTIAVKESFMRVSSLRKRFATARLLRYQLEQTHGVQISTQAIRNRLREYNLRSRNFCTYLIPLLNLAFFHVYIRAFFQGYLLGKFPPIVSQCYTMSLQGYFQGVSGIVIQIFIDILPQACTLLEYFRKIF